MEPYLPPANSGIWTIFWNLSPAAKVIVVILFFFSIISWAIIIKKAFYFRRLRKMEQTLKTIYAMRQNVLEILSIAQKYPRNFWGQLLVATEEELQRSASLSNTDFNENLLLNIKETLTKTINNLSEELEENLGFLATCSSVAPFLGLLGTVWGILQAFLSVRHVSIVTLQTIAPGIADALVTTVVGLLVAIPAAIAYNYFVGQVKKFTNLMESWQIEIINDLRRRLVLKSAGIEPLAKKSL
jgi:biopolymer transport protein TolQ